MVRINFLQFGGRRGQRIPDLRTIEVENLAFNVVGSVFLKLPNLIPTDGTKARFMNKLAIVLWQVR